MDKAERVFVKFAKVSKFPKISKGAMERFNRKYTRKTSLAQPKTEVAQNRLSGRIEYFDRSIGANRNKSTVDNTSEYWVNRGMSAWPAMPSAGRR